tara:strand:- start:3035 stop:3448 length:414 start_codon:yes stop_codon:yes gene_type:complete
VALSLFLYSVSACPQENATEPLLSVKEVMTALVVPTTNAIWRAQDVQSDAQWLQLQNAAIAIIAAGDLTARGGTGANDNRWASEKEWQQYNDAMIAAARQAIVAIEKRDLEALSEVGNSLLYPPCENCHARYSQPPE